MEERLTLLCEAGVIDKDIRDGMLTVAGQLESVWAISLHNEQGEMAMTHMASALMRSRRGEIISPLDETLMDEIRASEAYDQLLTMHQALLAPFDVALHPHEEGYLLANLYSLWMVAKA